MNRIPVVGFSLLLLSGLSACDRNDPTHNVNQTKFPGQVTAGGSTSGEIMARSKKSATVADATAGTPGIPEGSGGTTSGTEMGGTTPGAAGTQLPSPQQPTPVTPGTAAPAPAKQ